MIGKTMSLPRQEGNLSSSVRAGDKIWQEVAAEFRSAQKVVESQPDDDTIDRYLAALEAFLQAPAPDLNALRWKLQILLAPDDSGSIPEWSDRLVAQVRNDCQRLLSQSGAALEPEPSL